MRGEPASGESVRVCAADGAFLAWAAYSPRSQILARVWSWNQDEPPGTALVRKRLVRAIAARSALLPGVRAARLVHAESDALPGIVVDRYGDTLVVQLSSAGAAALRESLAGLLRESIPATSVYERSDAEVLELEGLQPRVGPLWGAAPADPLVIEEHQLKFSVSLTAGHKTGFYLDQRDNRALVRTLAADATVLDCFSYTGGFSVNALAGGARNVTAVETSAEALALAQVNLELNRLPTERCEWIRGDVFQVLRRLRDQARRFDLIVLDPPKFAPTAALAQRAARGYKDINLLAFKLLAPGGLLVTFSCSGGISRDLFQKIVAGAALDAGVEARILRHLGAGVDHPVDLAFPEGEYLKGLLCRVD